MHRAKRSIFLLCAMVPGLQAAEMEQSVEDSRRATAEFSSALKAELEAALYNDGPVKALEVCQLKAPGIAAAVSSKRGIRIGRTSLKVRNPANAPDEWERAVLERFQAQVAGGANPGLLEHYEEIGSGAKREFRYMKAIPMQGVCLACHGEQIAPEVKAALQRLYPEDQARGFKFGELRGAFTITRSID